MGRVFYIDPTNAMQNADMAVGWVGADSSLTFFYAYATGPYGPHPRDGNVGGKNHSLEAAGDEYDKPIMPPGGGERPHLDLRRFG